ncbi:MAG: hypothetical protein Q7R47_02820, partial [Candidatus Diapherotrites archaeon]|nr:hypothetical protein [Candidatus Diapherotrites archaeon]
TNFQFGMSKIDELESEHRLFLGSVKRLSETVNVSFTPSIRKELYKASKRKDGHTAYCYRICLQTHFAKIDAFNRQFPLKYAADKKRRLESEVASAIEYREKRSVP